MTYIIKNYKHLQQGMWSLPPPHPTSLPPHRRSEKMQKKARALLYCTVSKKSIRPVPLLTWRRFEELLDAAAKGEQLRQRKREALQWPTSRHARAVGSYRLAMPASLTSPLEGLAYKHVCHNAVPPHKTSAPVTYDLDSCDSENT